MASGQNNISETPVNAINPLQAFQTIPVNQPAAGASNADAVAAQMTLN